MKVGSSPRLWGEIMVLTAPSQLVTSLITVGYGVLVWVIGCAAVD
jgi:hypothetical protein